jgi:DNA-binding Xre family transcriptional regulator
MSYDIDFKLKKILEDKKMSQKQLSQLSGVRESTLSDIVRGARTVINFEHLSKISKALELSSINEIIDFKNNNLD